MIDENTPKFQNFFYSKKDTILQDSSFLRTHFDLLEEQGWKGP